MLAGDVATVVAYISLVPGLDSDWYSVPSKQNNLHYCKLDIGPALEEVAQHRIKASASRGRWCVGCSICAPTN